MFSHDSAIAVVTGASSGIGRAVSQGLAREGVTVCMVGRNSKELQELERYDSGSSGVCRGFTADLGNDEDIDSLVGELKSRFEGIDILVHSAGVINLGSVSSSAVDDLDDMYRINVRAPFLLTQKLLASLDNKNGQVVFVNSSAGRSAKPGAAQYAATKHGLKAIADSLRQEVNCRGIRVLSVYPGRTASPMQEKVYRLEGRDYAPELLLQPADIASIIVSSLKLPRTAEVTDIDIRHHAKV
jgi:NADP-dependent 3-hydroxy acid dehydrogenase YdfG